ncbi:MAG TPA: hypothetical protein DEF34_03265 [Desulfotomaculum sp.]|nr:MAG: hypothetical protein JL56_02885 [Desulfotomaculum sp. BICA1-6]HBX22647.1 hypothetical protein [Desulfotomaculum sp.]
MLSLKLAQKLKAAGLEWEPKKGDWLLIYTDGEKRYLKEPVLYDNGACLPWEEDCWLPRLDQLFAEIEARGYAVEVHFTVNRVWVLKKGINDIPRVFDSDTAEDAAARALLWILEQKKGA